MALSTVSRNFMLGFMALSFAAMFATAGLHMYAVLAQPKLGAHTPEMVPPPSAERDKSGAPEVEMSEAQMAEVSELMGKLKDNPNDSATLIALGENFFKANDWVRAEFFLSRAVLSRPSDIRPRYMLGIALHQQNKILQTVKTFEELLGVEEDPSTMYNLAVIYKYQANDPKRATELFNTIINTPGISADLVEKAKKELN